MHECNLLTTVANESSVTRLSAKNNSDLSLMILLMQNGIYIIRIKSWAPRMRSERSNTVLTVH